MQRRDLWGHAQRTWWNNHKEKADTWHPQGPSASLQSMISQLLLAFHPIMLYTTWSDHYLFGILCFFWQLCRLWMRYRRKRRQLREAIPWILMRLVCHGSMGFLHPSRMEACHIRPQSTWGLGKAILGSSNLSIPAQVAMDFDIGIHDRSPGLATEPADVLVATPLHIQFASAPNRYMFFLAIVILFSVAPNEALAWCQIFAVCPLLYSISMPSHFVLKWYRWWVWFLVETHVRSYGNLLVLVPSVRIPCIWRLWTRLILPW